ncbi:MAG: divalent-cation tolerance protein CutA [Paludibacter sp.]
MTDLLLALTTCPDADTAERIAEALVADGLAACVNQLPGVRSIYMWQGRIQRDQEVLLLIKTTQNQLATLAERLKRLHPYELPELIAVPVTGGSAPYLDWLRQNTAANDPSSPG